jgi:ATP-dependent Clp protease ATP-binding subunit ClpC
MEKHAVARLVGAPPGYVGHGEGGGQLTEAVRRRPHSLVLLDEVDKAHPEVMDVLLQVLDDGRLTDGMGRTVDFRNTLIIMTSNIGGGNGGSGDGSRSSSKEVVEEEMKRYFRPEFLNRLDETIVFRPLTRVDGKEIAAVLVSDVAARVSRETMMVVELRVTERFMDLVVEEGFDPWYGARALRRAVVMLLEDTLADKLLDGEIIKAGDTVIVDADAAGNVVVLGPDS